MDKPTPPVSPDIVQMHRYMLAMDKWHDNVTTQGVQFPFFTTEQIANMSVPPQSGKMVTNSDTGVLTYFTINPTTKVVTKKELP